MMPTDYERVGQTVSDRLDELAGCTARPGEVTRLYLTPEHAAANRLFASWCEADGIEHNVDAVGNVHAWIGPEDYRGTILFGSHMDTVINAGKYDGTLGVVAALQAIKRIASSGWKLRHRIEVVGFGDEEGVRFGATYLGSLAIGAGWAPGIEKRCDSAGISIEQALENFGLERDGYLKAKRSDIHAYFEVHIEQGSRLASANIPFSPVTGITSAKRFDITFHGKTGHAGSTLMKGRQDALCAAAAFVSIVNETALKFSETGFAVATVGKIEVENGAANCIPGKVTCLLDARCGTDEMLEDLLSEVFARTREACERHGTTFEHSCYYVSPAAHANKRLLDIVSTCVAKQQDEMFRMASGAGHDAAAIARRFPFAMAFVRDAGVSHCPEENLTVEDMGRSVALIEDIILEADHTL